MFPQRHDHQELMAALVVDEVVDEVAATHSEDEAALF